jgi:chemotaxis protein methyltransferase CheR
MTGSVQIIHPLVADPGHSRLKDFVIESTGLTYYANRDEDLADRIHRRLSKLGLPDCASYLRMLQDEQAGDGEFDALVAELTIGETYFFRHQEQFDALRDTILPDLIERKKHVRRLRIWSAGCATGPETYSVAILLNRELAHLVDGWDVSVLGTDINREFLARANEGKYDAWAFRSCPDDLKCGCFSPSGTSWAIKPKYKECVSFQYHNLVKHAFPSLLHNLSAFDLILCRNVMIYFSTDLIRKLLSQFGQCLVEGGWFLAGHAESNVELFRSFRTVNASGATLYQKSSEASYVPVLPLGDLEAPIKIVNIAPETEEQIQAPRAVSPVALSDIRLLADQGEFEKALQSVRAFLKQENLNPAAHFHHALVLEQMGLHIETECALRRAVYLDRNFVLAHYYLGLCLQKKRDTRGATRSFQNVLNFLPQVDTNQTFPYGDGITAADLRELTEMNLEVLQRS